MRSAGVGCTARIFGSRHNFRKDMDDYDRFKLAASQMVGKRLTWNEATGKNRESAMYPN